MVLKISLGLSRVFHGFQGYSSVFQSLLGFESFFRFVLGFLRFLKFFCKVFKGEFQPSHEA